MMNGEGSIKEILEWYISAGVDVTCGEEPYCIEQKVSDKFSRQEDLFALLSKNQLELDCLLKVARLRPMLLVKLNMNCFSVWTMAWLFVQPSYPLSGITDLFKVIEMSLMRHDVMENFYQLAYLGAERSEILGWIYANWKDCHMNRREVQIFLKKKQNKETFFSQLKRIMFNH